MTYNLQHGVWTYDSLHSLHESAATTWSSFVLKVLIAQGSQAGMTDCSKKQQAKAFSDDFLSPTKKKRKRRETDTRAGGVYLHTLYILHWPQWIKHQQAHSPGSNEIESLHLQSKAIHKHFSLNRIYASGSVSLQLHLILLLLFTK